MVHLPLLGSLPRFMSAILQSRTITTPMPTIGWSGYILFIGNVSAELMLPYLKTSMGTKNQE
jgi:hypothetical protein